jgi:hypothetical protein
MWKIQFSQPAMSIKECALLIRKLRQTALKYFSSIVSRFNVQPTKRMPFPK